MSLFPPVPLKKKQRCFLAREAREDVNVNIGNLANFNLHITHFFQFSYFSFSFSLFGTETLYDSASASPPQQLSPVGTKSSSLS